MKHLIEFTTEDHGSIVIEVEDPVTGGQIRAARPGEVITKASQSFGEALERVKPAASTIIQKLRSLSDQPDEIEVEFGLKLSADIGAVVASTGMEANYKVTLKWTKSAQQKNTCMYNKRRRHISH